jgi:hypothetical protein
VGRRAKVNEDGVAGAIERIEERGERVSDKKIRAELGMGSMETIMHLRRGLRAKKNADDLRQPDLHSQLPLVVTPTNKKDFMARILVAEKRAAEAEERATSAEAALQRLSDGMKNSDQFSAWVLGFLGEQSLENSLSRLFLCFGLEDDPVFRLASSPRNAPGGEYIPMENFDPRIEGRQYEGSVAMMSVA